MAGVIKTILKLTPMHCVVKVSGNGAASTISLATDLLWSSSTQTEVAGATQTVNIMGIYWSVPSTSLAATVVRNSVTIWNLQGQFKFDFRGWADTQQNTHDIVVTLPAVECEVVLELLKLNGYGNNQQLNSLI